jgi:hypothetical protein
MKIEKISAFVNDVLRELTSSGNIKDNGEITFNLNVEGNLISFPVMCRVIEDNIGNKVSNVIEDSVENNFVSNVIEDRN